MEFRKFPEKNDQKDVAIAKFIGMGSEKCMRWVGFTQGGP